MSAGGNIECHGCARSDGKPFVQTRVNGKPFGQLDPSEAIAMGTRFIQAGIEAERDAALIRGLLDNGASERDAAAHLMMIRHYRGQVDPDPRADVPPAPERRPPGEAE